LRTFVFALLFPVIMAGTEALLGAFILPAKARFVVSGVMLAVVAVAITKLAVCSPA
jgi:hypothetical protein